MSEPSAITTNEQAYRDGTLSQPTATTEKSINISGLKVKLPIAEPSAPTADVEKIARELAVDAYAHYKFGQGNSHWSRGAHIAHQTEKNVRALAQARAPLEIELQELKQSIADLSHPNCQMLLKDAERLNTLVEALEDAIERFAGAPDNNEDDEAAIARYRGILRVKEGELITTQKGDKQESDIIR